MSELKTQEVPDVMEMLRFLGRKVTAPPAEVWLGPIVLVLSNKKDVYYTCSFGQCSCPGNYYHKKCKHRAKYFPVAGAPLATSFSDPGESIRPTAKWAGGFKGPVLEAF